MKKSIKLFVLFFCLAAQLCIAQTKVLFSTNSESGKYGMADYMITAFTQETLKAGYDVYRDSYNKDAQDARDDIDVVVLVSYSDRYSKGSVNAIVMNPIDKKVIMVYDSGIYKRKRLMRNSNLVAMDFIRQFKTKVKN